MSQQKKIEELSQKNVEWEVFTQKLFSDIKERQQLRKKDNQEKLN